MMPGGGGSQSQTRWRCRRKERAEVVLNLSKNEIGNVAEPTSRRLWDYLAVPRRDQVQPVSEAEGLRSPLRFHFVLAQVQNHFRSFFPMTPPTCLTFTPSASGHHHHSFRDT